MEERHFTADNAGGRLDRFLAERMTGLSRTRIQKLIEDGFIAVNGRPARAGLKLAAGDDVRVSLPPPAPSPLTPEAMPLTVLYEDDDIIVVDKPAGVTVHPAPGAAAHTLVNALLARLPHLARMGESLRPGIVHRLDKDTSGVMVVAKNEPARLDLAEQFRARAVDKTYQVLVKGKLEPETGAIEAPIGRDSSDRKRMAVVAGGREARTEYKVIRYLKGFTLLEVRPETGRTHQIRVHFKAIGFPVAGDKVYGFKTPFLSRQFVHAWRLGIRLPATGEYKEFQADLPEDLKRALEAIEK